MADVWLAKVAEGLRPAIIGALKQGAPPTARMLPALEKCSEAVLDAKDRFAATSSTGFFGPVLASDIQLALLGVEAAMRLPGRERARAISVWEPKLRTAYVLLRDALPDHAECIRQLRTALDDLSTFSLLEDASPAPPHIPSRLEQTPYTSTQVEGVRRDVATTREVLVELSAASKPPTSIEGDARDFTIESGTAHAELAEALLDESPIDSNALSAEVAELQQLASSFSRTLDDLGQRASADGIAISRKFVKSTSDALRGAIKLVSQIAEPVFNPEDAPNWPSPASDVQKDTPPKDIILLGIGGAGGNAINSMIEMGFDGARIVAMNTDAQALARSKAPNTLLIGPTWRGLGAAAKPENGSKAAEESEEAIRAVLGNAAIVFLAAGMGGGTGSGATQVVARIAQSMGIATFGSMTLPFDFEGKRRANIAIDSINSTSAFLDAYVVLENQMLFTYANKDTTFADAFSLADKALFSSLTVMVDLATSASASNLDLERTADFLRGLGECAVAIGTASASEDIKLTMSKSFSRPHLSRKKIESSSHALVAVSGDQNLEPSWARQIVDAARAQLAPSARIVESTSFNAPKGTEASFYVLAKTVTS